MGRGGGARPNLFVAESFDRVEAGGADGRDHAADQSNGAEDQDGDDQGDGIDGEPDVSGFGVFGHGAVERKPADGEGNDVGEDDAEKSANEGNGESLGEKLEEDVAAAGAERLLDANFAGGLGDGDEHDIHQADATDAQREGADEGEQDLEAEGDDCELVNLLHQIKDHEGAAVGGIEFVLRGRDVAHGLLDPLIVIGLVIEPDAVEIVSVFEVTHGGERNVDDAVDIVVAGLHFGVENADNFEANAVEANVFAQGVASGAKLLLGFEANDGNASALDLILGVVETSLVDGQVADGESIREFAVDAHGETPSVLLHCA